MANTASGILTVTMELSEMLLYAYHPQIAPCHCTPIARRSPDGHRGHPPEKGGQQGLLVRAFAVVYGGAGGLRRNFT